MRKFVIKWSGSRPKSVGGFAVPWKRWDTAPAITLRQVQLMAHAPAMANLLEQIMRCGEVGSDIQLAAQRIMDAVNNPK